MYAGNNWSDGPDGLSTRKFGLKRVMGSTPIEIVSEWPVQCMCH